MGLTGSPEESDDGVRRPRQEPEQESGDDAEGEAGLSATPLALLAKATRTTTGGSTPQAEVGAAQEEAGAHPGGDEEHHDKPPVPRPLGEVVEGAGGEVALGDVAADPEEGQRGEEDRVEPNKSRLEDGALARRPPSQRMSDHRVPFGGDSCQEED